MRVIIAGTKELCSPKTTFDAIQEAIKAGFQIDEVVCGMCPGPDLLGKRWADEHGIPVREMPANWPTHGPKKAGPIRNVDMAVYAKTGPDGGGLILIHTGESSGSLHMKKTAKHFNLKFFEKIVK